MAEQIRQAPTLFSSGQYKRSDATKLVDSDKPSRLSKSTEEIREGLMSRNLYGEFNEYPLAENTTQQVVNAINTVLNVVMPFKSYDLRNTVYGRLITNPTPLTEIGLIMLGKQFAMNAGSHIAQQNFPIIKPSNLFDGNRDTKLFEKNIEYNITKKEQIGTFDKFLELIQGNYPKRNYQLTTMTAPDRNSVFIRNTGEGQLDTLLKNLNRNLYKQSQETDTALKEAAEKTNNEFVSSYISALRSNRKFFSEFFNKKFNPYYYFNYSSASAEMPAASDVMLGAYSTQYDDPEKQEYGAADLSPFGTTVRRTPNVEIDSEFKYDDESRIVWGRDGTTRNASLRIGLGRGDDEGASSVGSELFFREKFNVKTGLLEYTRNLLNATEGKHVDITKKVFETTDNQYRIDYSFNGSGLWIANKSAYAEKAGTAGKRGVRQHTVLDQYNKFTKTIRFNGNKVYDGNPDSVIYDSVMPRIHPTIDSNGRINNRSLMFAIENLAIETRKDEEKKIGLDDEGNYLPIEEVGPFNGRVMWFPPYNITFNETSTAKYESTVMVGRNEPIYNYIHSERSCNFNFDLIIDYPPQLRNFIGSGQDRYKAIAEFFAFGGDKEITEMKTIANPDEEIKKREDKIEEIKGVDEETVESEKINPIKLNISFPNDQPTAAQVTTIFDEMYGSGYEVAENLKGNDATNFGLNKFIFAQIGLAGSIQDNDYRVSSNWNLGGDSQYTTTEDNELNNVLRQVFDNEENWGLYKINIIGGSSKLYYDASEEVQYNDQLGARRAVATEHLIKERLKALYPTTPLKRLDIVFGLYSKGSEEANISNGTVSAISKKDTKEERYAIVEIVRNSKILPKKEKVLTASEQREIAQLQEEIENIKTQKNQQKTIAERGILKERRVDTETGSGNDAILDKGKAFSENYYYPAFHSQTPEDFHKRLTFLQQCLRQGSAERYDMVNENGFLRAKNSVFGRQPICILRVGDFFYTKVIIESINIDYTDAPWDMNPEGFGMQPMIAKVTMQMKLIGGQSLKGPIDALQNAVAYNYYANSTFTDKGIYRKPSYEAALQEAYIRGIDTGVYETIDDKETRVGNKAYEEVLQLLEQKTEE